MKDSPMASDNEYYYEPAKGHGLPHDPFNAIIGPRPIGWISSHDAAGKLNLAPYSFFNAFNYKPPIIGFSATTLKDSTSNIQATGEFVWNLATRALAEAMNATSASVPHGVDEFELAGLTPAPCRLVKVPRVAESPVAMECKLLQSFQLHDKEGRVLPTWMTFGEVVAVHIDKSLLRDGIYDTAAARPIMRAGGPGGYAEITPEVMFELFRPG
jgi:flavin reductase (DIM6/NTAB) family NADH-FMN oxidoreductase RutF